MRFLAIGLDPTSDTPEALATWVESRGGDPTRWLTAGGSPRETVALRDAVIRALGDSAPPDRWSRLFLIDDRMQLRGSYAMGDRGADEVYHRA